MRGGRSRRSSDGRGPSGSSLTEARKLKQQAERKPAGAAREGLLMQCVGKFEAALQEQLSPADYEECLFDFAEALLLMAEAVKKVSSSMLSPLDGAITKPKAIELQMQGFIKAADFYRKSFEAYESVRALGKELKQEATVNCGNILCDWSEILLELPQAVGVTPQKLYDDAYARYSEALIACPEDTEVLVNFGDCCIRRAELLLGGHSISWESVEAVFDEAFQAYSTACSLTDTRKGDDLCGLLQNWAAGLSSKGKAHPSVSEAMRLFEIAREKLENASKLNPTDTNCFNALGELYMAEAERCPSSTCLEEGVTKLLSAATECFMSALKIDGSNINALLGIAEAYYMLSKCRHSRELAVQSTSAYSKAIELLRADSEAKYDLSFTQQSEVLYNFACSAALCGQESVVCSTLQQLVLVKGVTADELLSDPDFDNLKSKPWFLPTAPAEWLGTGDCSFSSRSVGLDSAATA